MSQEYSSSVQSSSSANEQSTIGTNTRVITELAHKASQDEFLNVLEGWITTAHNWMKVTEGPVINITLTPHQEVEVKTLIKTLEGVRKMYEEMMEGESTFPFMFGIQRLTYVKKC